MALQACKICGFEREEERMLLRGGNYFCSWDCYSIFFTAKCSTAVVTKVNSSDVNVTLLVANADRRTVSIYNNSSKDLYIKFGETASVDSFTVLLTGSTYFELQYPCYTGRIDGFWEAVDGSAMVTEIT